MNSIRYLAGEDHAVSRAGAPVAAYTRGSAIAPDPPKLSLIWRLLLVLVRVLHLSSSAYSPRNGSASSADARRRAKKKRTTSSSAALPPIPRLFAKRERKLLVLDLDETLVHSMARGYHRTSQMVEVHLRHTAVSSFYYVEKRPFCIDFLTAVMQWYDVAIFTASVCEYADPIIDLLERDVGRKCFKRRLYRDSCVADGNGGYIKDLRVFGCDLSRVLLVDNSPISFARQRCNGLAVEGWISDPSDRTLLQLLPLLFALRHTSDVRSILSLHAASLIPAAR